MRHLGIALFLLLPVSLARADSPGTSDKLGKVIEPVLRDAGKNPLKWADLRGEKATVVFFLSFDCPNSTGCTPTVLNLVEKFGKEKIKFIGVCESEHSAEELKAKIAEFKLPFPVVTDPGQAIAGHGHAGGVSARSQLRVALSRPD